MPPTVVLDEMHLTFRIPATLPAQQVKAIRRTLNKKSFTAALRRAVISVLVVDPTLKPLQLEVSR